MFPGPRSIILVGALLFYNSVFPHFSHISHFRSIILVGALLFYNSVSLHFSHISHFRSTINVSRAPFYIIRIRFPDSARNRNPEEYKGTVFYRTFVLLAPFYNSGTRCKPTYVTIYMTFIAFVVDMIICHYLPCWHYNDYTLPLVCYCLYHV